MGTRGGSCPASSQERNRAIVETALDALVTMDATGIVTDWNGQASAVFGWS